MMSETVTSQYDVIDLDNYTSVLDADWLVLLCDVVIILAVVLGIIGNILLCICIIKTRSLRTYINASLMSTLIGNLIACMTLLPLRVYLFTASKTDTENWDMLCRAAVFFRTFCDTLQLFMLITVSYERYKSVANPFKKDGRARRTTVLIGLSWTAASGLSFLSAFVFVDSSLVDKCLPNTPSSHLSWGTHDLYLIFPFGIGTLLIIVVFYSLIMLTLYKHRKKMTSHKNHRKNKVVPHKKEEVFKGVDKSSSNTDISAIKLRTPQHFKTRAEKTSKYCDSNLDEKNKTVDRECKENGNEEQTSHRNSTLNQRASLFSRNKSADRKLDAQKEQIFKGQENLEKFEPEPSSVYNIPEEKTLGEGKNVSTGTSVKETKTYLQTPENGAGIKNGYKTELSVKIGVNSAARSDVASAVSYQRPPNGVKADCEIQIYDINGVVNRVSTKDTSYSGSVCVINSQSRELGKRKVEVRAAKRIAVMIGVFIILWMPLPLTVLWTKENDFFKAQAHSLVITATLGMCSVVVNPILHSVLNRQLHASLMNMVQGWKCGWCKRHSDL